jgi:uncharacterized protein (TIGR03382 family)
VSFQVVLDVDTGNVVNQAVLSVAPIGPGTVIQFLSDSSMQGTGVPTTFQVDECSTNADCVNGPPLCQTAMHPNRCVTCLSTHDCNNPTAPVCNVDAGTCEGCSSDADCNKNADLTVCNAVSHACAAPPPTAGSKTSGGCSSSGGWDSALVALLFAGVLLLSRRRRA